MVPTQERFISKAQGEIVRTNNTNSDFKNCAASHLANPKTDTKPELVHRHGIKVAVAHFNQSGNVYSDIMMWFMVTHKHTQHKLDL